MSYSGQFQPASDENAIVEMVVFFNFAQKFSSTELARLKTLKDIILPSHKYIPIQGLTFSFEANLGEKAPQSAMSSLEDGGFELHSVSTDGNIERIIKVDGKTIALHCLTYSRWENEWRRLAENITLIFQTLGVVENNIVSVGLKYKDSFTAERAASKDYDINGLFNHNTYLLSSSVFTNNRARWHSHTGWFAKFDSIEALETLNQLNINAGFATKGGARLHATTIEHNLTVHHRENGDVGTVLGDLSAVKNNLKMIMDILHSENKKILCNLLTVEMLTRIGIKDV